MTPADKALLNAILAAVDKDDRETLRLIREYWHDLDRADRTGRDSLYLHLGIASGIALRLLDERTVH